MSNRLIPQAIGAVICGCLCCDLVEGETTSAVTERINFEIRRHWLENETSPSRLATDGEWTRRVFLDLIGRIPRVSEIDEFLRASKLDRRRQLVRRLIYDDRYAAEFARNWATIWTNLTIGRDSGRKRNSLIDRSGMQTYFHDAFANHLAYDALVSELITAEGTNKPELENFNGAVNFLTMKLAEKGVQATADTARLFLGKQVQCTQCHDHPFNEWKQNQFWELNSFFRQAVALRRFDSTSGMVAYVDLSDQDFAGEGVPPTPDEAEVYFEARDATLRAAYPVFIDNTELSERSGRVATCHRRRELAKHIVASKDMPRAITNRMWAHFFNQAFTKPVDDMGPHNPPTHPELLDYLAGQFAANSFDLRLLMEWIATSDPYALSSRTTKLNAADDPSKGVRPLFTHYYVRQMRPEELCESLITASHADRLKSGGELKTIRAQWLNQFVIESGNDDVPDPSTFVGTISQSLTLFNGQLTRQALSAEPGGMISSVANGNVPYDTKVDQLFRSALARRATKIEKQAAVQLLYVRRGNHVEGLRDLWWAILNSNEFILNH